MWNYEQALRFLEGFVDNERRSLDPDTAKVAFSLDEFERFLTVLGNPQRTTKFIHIAGTKGKGSTALFLASIMRNAGYRMGLYTSPHLRSFCERMSVNGVQISEAEFAALFEQIEKKLGQFAPRPGRIFPTVFELLTAAAFLYFACSNVEVAVVETGLGGRLDSTNVVSPVLTIITAIGRDHVHVLGGDLRSIAREKAGIIKKNIPVIISPQTAEAQAEAVPAIEEVAKEQDAPLVRSADLVHVEGTEISEGGQKITFGRREGGDIRLETSALSVAQVDNLTAVLAAVASLRKIGFRLPDDSIQKGVKESALPGRTEIVSRHPVVIVDGAHCPLSARALSTTLRLLYPKRKILYLFGILIDKEIDAVIEELLKVDAPVRFIVFNAPNPRACPAEALEDRVRNRGVAVRVSDSAGSALGRARQEAGDDEIIVGAGSIYNIAPLKEALSRHDELS